MNIADNLSVMEHAYPEGFLDAVVNIFHMVLEGAPVISLRDFSQV